MKKLLLLSMLAMPIINFAQCFVAGTGSEGAFHATVDTTIAGAQYNFTTFTIDAGITVNVTGNNPLEIYCQGTATINGILDASGGSGLDGVTFSNGGTGGIGVAGGMNGGDGSYSSGSGPIDGTDGLNSGGIGTKGIDWTGGGGAGYALAGSATGGPTGGFAGSSYGDVLLTGYPAGSGGGGGSGGYECGAGGGGAGGGIIIFYANTMDISSTGQIKANGGNGGSDGTGNCGGGGAGSGGTIFISAVTLNNDGGISTDGGIGGASNVAGSPYYGIGGNGSVGRIRIDHANAITGTGTISPAQGSDNPVNAPVEVTQLFTICFGESVMVGTSSYNTTGIYQDIFAAANGCDSIVTTDLTVENQIDLNVAILNETLTSAENNATYQWLNCGTGNSQIQGANGQSFTATANGSYAVIVTINGCSDTSACMVINSTGVSELTGTEIVSIYPNPTKGNFFIAIDGMQNNNYTVVMYDLYGKVIETKKLNSTITEINSAGLPKGMYIIELISPINNQQFRVVLD